MSSGMQSRWGKLLEKKLDKKEKRKGRARGQSQGGNPPSPRSGRVMLRDPIEDDDAKSKTTLGTFVSSGQRGAPVEEDLICPSCKLRARDVDADTLVDFRMHVFHCRLAHGSDPTLPVLRLIPQPPEVPQLLTPPRASPRGGRGRRARPLAATAPPPGRAASCDSAKAAFTTPRGRSVDKGVVVEFGGLTPEGGRGVNGVQTTPDTGRAETALSAIPPAAVRPIVRGPLLQELKTPAKGPKETGLSDAQREACGRVNRLALRQLLGAKQAALLQTDHLGRPLPHTARIPRSPGSTGARQQPTDTSTLLTTHTTQTCRTAASSAAVDRCVAEAHHLDVLLHATKAGSEVDVSELSLTPEDIAVLSSVIAEHPSATFLTIGSGQDAEASEILAPMMVGISQRNDNVIKLSHRVPIPPGVQEKLTANLDRAFAKHYVRTQEKEMAALMELYTNWSADRAAQVVSLKQAECDGRRAVAGEHRKEHKGLKVLEKMAIKRVKSRNLRRMMLAAKARQRQILAQAEEKGRAALWLTVATHYLKTWQAHQDGARALLEEENNQSRRQAKSHEERCKKLAKNAERARLEREKNQRLGCESAEQDARRLVEDSRTFFLLELEAMVEESNAYLKCLEAQKAIRRELMHTAMVIVDQIKQDEEETRRRIYDRRAMLLQAKEQERLRAQQMLVQEEADVRSFILKNSVAEMALAMEELEARHAWGKEKLQLGIATTKLQTILRRPIECEFAHNYAFNYKPSVYCLHINTFIEPSVPVNSTSQCTWALDEAWAEDYNAAVERVQQQTAVEQAALAACVKLEEKNEAKREATDAALRAHLEAAYSKGLPISTPKMTPKTRQGMAATPTSQATTKETDLSQPALTVKQKRRSMRKAKKQAPLKKEKVHETAAVMGERKCVIRGGYIHVRLLEADTPYAVHNLRVHFAGDADNFPYPLEVDGVAVERDYQPQDEAITANSESEASNSNALDIGVDVEVETDTGEYSEAQATYFVAPRHCGRRLKLTLPNGLDAGALHELVHSLQFCSAATAEDWAAPMPAVVDVEVELELYFTHASDVELGKFHGDLPDNPEVNVCRHVCAFNVALAKPFLAYPAGVSDQREFVEGMKVEDLNVFPEALLVTDPPTVTRSVTEPNAYVCMAGGQQGQGLSLTNFDQSTMTLHMAQGFTDDDFLCYKAVQGRIMFDYEAQVFRFRERGNVIIARVVEGNLWHTTQVEKMMEKRSQAVAAAAAAVATSAYPSTVKIDTSGGPVACSKVTLAFKAEEPGHLSGEYIRLLMLGLRFANISESPVEGTRLLTVKLEKEQQSSGVAVRVEVVGKDDPTEMTIPNTKLVIRRSEIPSAFRQYCAPQVVLLAGGATVTDIDTDYFRGGSLKVVFGGLAVASTNPGCAADRAASKGEGIGLCFDINVIEGPVQRFQDGLGYRRSSRGSASLKKLRGSQVTVFRGGAGKTTLSLVNGNEIWSDEGMVARVVTGVAVTTKDDLDRLDGQHAVELEFTDTGHMSILACQVLLRMLVWVGRDGQKFSGMRGVKIELSIGQTVDEDGYASGDEARRKSEAKEIECVLEERITLRHAPALLLIPERYASVEYREGSGAQRIAPFDLVQDKLGFVEHYNAAWVMVEILEGGNEDDVLALRSDGTFSLTKAAAADRRRSVGSPAAKSPASTPSGLKKAGAFDKAPPPGMRRPSGPGDFALPGPEATDEGEARASQGKKTLKDKLKAAAKNNSSAGQRNAALQLNDVAEMATARQREMQHIQQQVVTANELGRTLGNLSYHGPSNVLAIEFSKDPSPAVAPLSRRTTLSLLKDLTYSNVSQDPQVLKKIIRITISDQPQAVSQCIVELNIIPVNDVTEFVVSHQRMKYIPPGDSLHPFFICPYGFSRLEDADTEYFDGGYLHVYPIGALKGDTLSFQPALSEDEQLAFEGWSEHDLGRVASAGGPLGPTALPPYTGPWYNLKLGPQEGKQRPILWFKVAGDGEEDTSEPPVLVGAYSYSAEGQGAVRITFAKAAEESKRVVTLQLASFILNRIAFANGAMDMRKAGTRQLQMKVSDGVNPVEGKLKLTIDNAPPLLYFQPWGEYVREVAFPAGEKFALFDAQVKLLCTAPGKGQFYVSGSLTISVDAHGPEAESHPGDVPSLVFPSGFKVVGDVLQGPQGNFLGEFEDHFSQTYRITFSNFSKMTHTRLQEFIKAVALERPQAPVPQVKVSVQMASGMHSTACSVVVNFA
eukprot:TRINITY_DN20404_c0_g1_i1.p1 TRINITY_DN20404_c0_g1~~TRINITY_DN20404_c0_g1_i1.p1  ORF type:complete len:2225 (+),score=657.40 TRINITY_DN20404_c0_g1_i1:129-6803(+)